MTLLKDLTSIPVDHYVWCFYINDTIEYGLCVFEYVIDLLSHWISTKIHLLFLSSMIH